MTLPANSGTYQLPQFFSVVDDNTNEPDQFFTVVAEIGPDVPEGTSCFKVNEYDASCFGRRGATIIKDNDRKLNKISELRSSFTICLAMVIGFTERSGTVSEAAGLPSQLFRLNIGVSSLRTSEIEHPITFRVREDRSTANVQPLGSVGLSDAFFGSIPDRDVLFVLGSGIRIIPPLTTFIVDDITVEIDECFTIRMFFTHAPGPREPRVTCNDGDGATSFFCEHTFCIEDNDGIKSVHIKVTHAYYGSNAEPFVVGFVQTTYTVLESVGSVEVCVELTQPQTEIYDATVTVTVVNYSSSTYIPPGATLASKRFYNTISLYREYREHGHYSISMYEYTFVSVNNEHCRAVHSI